MGIVGAKLLPRPSATRSIPRTAEDPTANVLTPSFYNIPVLSLNELTDPVFTYALKKLM